MSMVTFEDMDASLNARIGKLAPDTRVGHNDYFKYREVDDERYELVWRRSDACSYALIIRKLDNIIVGWRFVEIPAPTGCKFQNVRQLM
jgi:hypothetical protein